MDKGYAFITGTDVFHTIFLSDTVTIGQRWIDGMSSNPYFIKSNLYPQLCFNSTWDGNNFYLPNSEDPISPTGTDEVGGNIKFAGIVNDTVFGIITFDVESFSSQHIEMLDAAMQSDPFVVEIPQGLSVDAGWTYDGNMFKQTEGQ